MVDDGRVHSDQDAPPEALELAINGKPHRALLRPGEVLLVGRDPACQIVVPDRSVSRRHAEIRRVGDTWVIRDLGSRNGIHLNGERADEFPVTGGAQVRIGSPHDGPVLTFALPRPRGAESVTQAAAPMPAATARSGEPRAQEPPPTQELAPPREPAPTQELPPVEHPAPATQPLPTAQTAPATEPLPPAQTAPATQPLPPAQTAPAQTAPATPPSRSRPDAPVVSPVVSALEPPLPAPPAPSAPPRRVREAPGTPVGRPEIAAFDAAGTTTIGRSASCDIVLYDLLVSRRHAMIRQVGQEHHLIDLGSTNGTYLNGRRISRAVLRAGDLVSIGHYELTFDGRRLHERVDAGPISLTAERITVDIGSRRIVEDVSFSLEQGSLLGIIGPSGCGKSTLVRAVAGLQQASGGRVTYDGRDLYADYAELRYRIGMVPQDDVLHRQLTVRRALRFAASLRFADDVSRSERHARVEEVMQTLGLTHSAKQRIDRLSGGQRKRTSVALELLTEPSMLCLDEPTSGLDPALDRDVMRELRALADRGRTVLCITHSVLHLDYCDRVLVLCPGGTTGYFGPPEELLRFFEAEDYADVFAKVTRQPEYWTRRYRESPLYRRYVVEPIVSALAAPRPAEVTGAPQANGGAAAQAAGGVTGAPARPAEGPDHPPEGGFSAGGVPPPAPLAKVLRHGRTPLGSRARDPVAPLRQFTTLSLRMFAVTIADRGYALFLLGLPMVLALLSHAVPGGTGLAQTAGVSGDERLEAMRILVVLVVGAAFIGISSAIREIVNESTIYKRERAVGLSPGAYLAGKFVVLGIINVIQVTVFVWLSLLGRGGPDAALVLGSPMLEIIVPVAMVTTSATMLGLCISALARSVAQTTPVLVVVVMAMLVLSGGLFELSGQAVLEQVSWLSPTRWGFAAGAATVDLLRMVQPIYNDPLWVHTAEAWWRAILLLTLQVAALTTAARLAMNRLEPGRS